jgi:Fibrinogen beta and gamma chains, C-terminal globular domain
VLGLVGCAQLFGLDATTSSPPTDVPTETQDASPDAALGTMANPAASCLVLLTAIGPTSGVYWVTAPGMPPFEVYCDQQTNGGGWAMLFNSVRTNGQTTAFWQIPFAARLDRKGTRAPSENFYDGALYRIGTSYMDVLVDVQGTLAVAAVMSASGIDTATMRFIQPALVVGNSSVFTNQFASGWGAPDFDGDTFNGSCSTTFSNVTQHYSSCWSYNLGSDADDPVLDGGVGPHANNAVLTDLGLAAQPNGGAYSQLSRIARFVRW